MSSVLEKAAIDATLVSNLPIEGGDHPTARAGITNDIRATITSAIETTLHLSSIGEGTVLPFMDLTVCRRLGGGGMGTVYLARNTQGSMFAVKVMDTKGDATNTVRAQREFDVVQHAYTTNGIRCVPEPHALSVLQNGTETLHCLVTEFMPGKDMDTLIKERGPLEPKTALWFARKAAEGLTLIHEAKMVHRDIKPANIMVGTESPDKEDVVFMDFGLVRSIDEKTVTLDSSFCGTLPYSAPEVFTNGGKSNSAPCDVYALGITFYEMLTGKRPLEFQNPLEYFAFFQKGGLTRLVTQEDCPTSGDADEQKFLTGFFDLILEMTHPDPRRRFTAAQVQDALRSMVNIPDTPEAKLILASIDHQATQHSAETVRTSMTQTASHISFGDMPASLGGFNNRRTMEFTMPSATPVQAETKRTRSKFSSLLGVGGAVTFVAVAATLWNSTKKEILVPSSSTSAIVAPKLEEVPTAPIVVEKPKPPSHVAFVKNEDGEITEVELGINTRLYSALVTKKIEDALIIEDKDDPTKLSCIAFLLSDPDERKAAMKVMYRDKKDPPSEQADRLQTILFSPETGTVYYPGMGIGVPTESGMATFTQQEINQGLHLENETIRKFLETLHLGNVRQHFPQDVVQAAGYKPNFSENLGNGLHFQIDTLRPKAAESIQPVSGTSDKSN